MRRLGISIISVILIFNLANAAEPTDIAPPDTDPVQERAWPDWLHGEFIQAGSLVATAIFSGLGRIKLYDHNFSAPYESAQVQIGRVVYDNEDVANTYSVVDHIQVKTMIPVYIKSLLQGTRTLSWGLGSSEGLVVEDIRQSRKKEITDFYTDLPALKSSAQKWYDATVTAPDQPAPQTKGANTTEVVTPTQNTKDSPDASAGIANSLINWDPLRTAQYSKLLNMLSFPVRIPFKAEALKNLDEGEIISYNGSGTLSLAFNVGWNFDPTSLTTLTQAGLSLSTYLTGEFEIAILKEDSRYAQVKVTRAYRQGYNESIGAKDRQDIISGFIIGRRMSITQSIVPFQFTADQSTGHTFDVGYRFDMNDPQAREAYEKAVLGSFESAETLSSPALNSPQQAPVSRVFTVKSADTADLANSKFRVGFIFKAQQSSDVVITDAQLILPNGTSKVLEAVTTDEDSNSFLIGSTSQFRYKYTVYLDEDAYAQGKDGSFRLMAEGFIDNTATHGDDLYRYMDEVEGIVGASGVFPRPPARRPWNSADSWWDDLVNLFNTSFVAYGHTNFYYRLDLTQAQTEKFINTPDDQIWPIMEKAYGVSPGTWANLWDRSIYGLTDDLVQFFSLNWLFSFSLPDVTALPRLTYASIFANGWSAMHGVKDPVDLSKRLARLFSDRWFSFEQMKILRLALSTESVGYIASGSNHSFGYIWQQNNVIADSAPFQKLNQAESFDKPWDQSSFDTESVVTASAVEVDGADEMKVLFNTKILPVFVYFRINEVGFLTNPTLVELTLDNKNGQFVAGNNALLIEASHGAVDQGILKQLVNGKKYILSLAVSKDGTHWGARSDRSFVYKY